MNDYVVTIDGRKKNIILKDDNKVFIDGNEFDYEVVHLSPDTFLLNIHNKNYLVTAGKSSPDSFSVYIDGRIIETTVRSALQEKAIKLLEESSAAVIHKTSIKAPMPGMILKIKKAEGEPVHQGESVIILEAMKMENDLRSPASGIIKNISVKEGSAVEKGTVLFWIE